MSRAVLPPGDTRGMGCGLARTPGRWRYGQPPSPEGAVGLAVGQMLAGALGSKCPHPFSGVQ